MNTKVILTREDNIDHTFYNEDKSICISLEDGTSDWTLTTTKGYPLKETDFFHVGGKCNDISVSFTHDNCTGILTY